MKATYLHGPIIKEMSQALLFAGEKAGHNGMKLDKSRQYQYVKIDNYYFCLQQNPVVLAWLLFLKREDLITIQPWLKKKNMPRWRMICSRYYWNILKRNLLALLVFTQCRLNLRKFDTVHLPVYGQFGMSVHKGYKIFNLRTGMVAKIFDPDVDRSSVASEIEQLKEVSNIDFAPSLRRWDIAEGWYQEDYIRSKIATPHRSADSGTLLKAFYQEAVPCMNSLISYQGPLTKDLQMYLEELNRILDVSRLLKNKSNLIESRILRDFVNSAVGQLKAEGNRPVRLVFTHGDFCPANFLNTKHGLRIVDWETATHRSLLFDFYSYFFYRPVSPKLPVDKMVSEINEALPFYLSQLPLKAPDITNVSALVHTYRQLYYIERLCTLVERDLTDNRLNMTDYVIRYIKAWTEYEEILNADVVKKNNETDSILIHNGRELKVRYD